MDTTNSKYDVNKDVVNGRLVDEVDSSADQVEEVVIIDGKAPVVIV